MKMPVEAVHLIRLFGVELPDCFRLDNMEARSIILIESLHLGDVVEAVIIVVEALNPSGGTAVFRSFQHQLGLYHMICDF